MGIYIKNMKMPTSCATCELFGEYGCPLIGTVTYALTRGKRHKDCPLISVPEHGRLVDTRYIDSENDRFFDMSRASEEFDEHASAYAYSLIANILANAPTVIPASEEDE